ncbi:hypothetical protein WA538_002747 [Blastocystis sp. DL]
MPPNKERGGNGIPKQTGIAQFFKSKGKSKKETGSTTPKERSHVISPKKTSPQKDQQTVLSIGQKVVVIKDHHSKERLITCPICGTLYDSDSPEDKNMHNSICNIFYDGVKWTNLVLVDRKSIINKVRARIEEI